MLYERHFPQEGWERDVRFAVRTSWERLVREYSGLTIPEVLDLPYDEYLPLRRDSWLDRMTSCEPGRELLSAGDDGKRET